MVRGVRSSDAVTLLPHNAALPNLSTAAWRARLRLLSVIKRDTETSTSLSVAFFTTLRMPTSTLQPQLPLVCPEGPISRHIASSTRCPRERIRALEFPISQTFPQHAIMNSDLEIALDCLKADLAWYVLPLCEAIKPDTRSTGLTP